MSKIFCTFAVDLEMRIKPLFKNRSRAWGKTLKLPNRSEAQWLRTIGQGTEWSPTEEADISERRDSSQRVLQAKPTFKAQKKGAGPAVVEPQVRSS